MPTTPTCSHEFGIRRTVVDETGSTTTCDACLLQLLTRRDIQVTVFVTPQSAKVPA